MEEKGFMKSMFIIMLIFIIGVSIFYGVKFLYELNFGGWIYAFKLITDFDNISTYRIINIIFCVVAELLIYWIELFILKSIFSFIKPVYNKYTQFIFSPFIPLFKMFKSTSNKSNVSKKINISETVDLETTSKNIISIPNPYRGLMIIGGAGSGKSESLAIPLIREYAKLNFTGIIYDFKFPSLAKEVDLFYKNKPIKHYVLNLNDAHKSHRVNPLHPRYMPHVAYAREYAQAIIKNLMRESIRKEDFFSRSATDLLTACIWYLKRNHPNFCDLPHVFGMITSNYKNLIKLLSEKEETKDMIISLATALESGAGDQLAGVVGSLQGAISQINTPEFMYILGADDFNLNLNDPLNPSVLTVGSNPTISSALSPICSLIITVASKQMNTPNRQSSFIMLDESPTIFIPNIEVIPNTGRSNKISTVLFCQDISQLNDSYGKEKAEVLFASCLNHFYGRVASSHTADILSKQFGKEDKYFESKNSSRNTKNILFKNFGKTYAVQEREIFRSSAFMNLPVGTFIGKISDSNRPFFYEKFKVVEEKNDCKIELPKHSESEIMEFYKCVKRDIDNIFRGTKTNLSEIKEIPPKKKNVSIDQTENTEEKNESESSSFQDENNNTGHSDINDELTRLWNKQSR